MRSCQEIRREGWKILRGKWFWRLLTVGCVLQLIAVMVNGLITSAFAALSITSASDFLTHKVQAWQSGLDYTLPTLRAYGWMMSGFLFHSFIGYIFAAILAYGFMGALLKARANQDEKWFSDSFGGFARPFEVTGLLVLMNLKVFLWSLLFLVPGLVAVYRYRLAWFHKNEHPDWTARACLAESGRLMKGVKGKAFLLDLSYFGWLLLATLCLGAGSCLPLTGALGKVGGFLGFLVGGFGFYLFLKTVLGMAVARAIFYRELVPEV